LDMEVSMRKLNTSLIILLISAAVVLNTFAKTEPRLVIDLPRWSGYDIALHPDGKIVASASLADIIHTFNIETGEMITELEGHEKGVESVAYSPKGNILVSGDQSGFNKIWDVETNEIIKELDKHAWVIKDIEFSRDGSILATGDWGWGQTLRLWNPETGKLLHGIQAGKVDDISFSFDGKVIASGVLDTGLVQLWDTETGELLQTLETEMEHVFAVAFFGAERMLVVGGTGGMQTWDGETGERVKTFNLPGNDKEIRTVAVNPDQKMLASGGNDSMVHLWDLKTLKVVDTLDLHFGRMHTVTFSSDGLTLATSANDSLLGIWDIEPLGPIILFSVNPKDKTTVLWGHLKQR
ncbi:WD40 repeat domain-containing protein, partial [Candidatus Poribacteria bacterium]|nr:WD40 repeat domain-containing protein [Candidatus Poribacteria bacterium]